jgi:UDP-2,3-diacylglucosamine pyrophosphatase LpxH
MESTHNFLFVSDLHLSEGRNPATSLIHRNEDFFHDLAFAQFLAHHVNLSRDPNAAEYYQKPWKLVVNGDIFDFLQVVSKPLITMKDGEAWVTLDVVDEDGHPMQVEKSLSDNERKYGLGTTSEEIVFKLNTIAAGHPQFFQALAWFVAHEGNELVLMKGNHDIEIVWPAAQKRMSQLLVASYANWRLQIKRGDVETPLRPFPDLPDTLSIPTVESAIDYPTLYYYEKGVFYAEHGCQYDPANAFMNFENPKLPDRDDLIELPSGSLFVRYFFNIVETVHPFADNMKPKTRYIFWLLRSAPTSLFQYLFDLLPGYLRTIYQVNRKTRKRSKENLQAAKNDFEKALFTFQAESRHDLRRKGTQTFVMMVISVILVLISVVLAFWGVRLLALGSYWWMVSAFVGTGLLVLLSSYLFKLLDKLLEDSFLYKAAVSVCQRLNSDEEKDFNPVPYFVFGHDHAARVQSIKPDNNPGFRQWYINTGAWVPIFSDSERLLRDDEQLTFLRLVPSRIAADAHISHQDVPELLQWSPEANAPLPVRLFE